MWAPGRLAASGSPRAATQGRPYKNIIDDFELRDSFLTPFRKGGIVRLSRN